MGYSLDWEADGGGVTEDWSLSSSIFEAVVMSRRYLAKESILVISENSWFHSWDSGSDIGEATGV